MTADAGPGVSEIQVPAGVTVRRVGSGEAERRRALGLLMTGRDAPRDPRVPAFEQYARRAGLDTSGLTAAFDAQDRPIAAAVAMPSPGRTAMLLVSPIRGGLAPASAPGSGDASGSGGDPRVAAAGACVAATIAALPETTGPDITMAQCLLEPDQSAEAAALKRAGFSSLATLVYLQAALPRAVSGRKAREALPGVTMRGDDGACAVQLRPWDESPETRQHFGTAILASYRDTLDCPGLVGTRNIDDILAGHRGSPGTHAFDPALWTVAVCNGQAVGVLLLARLPEQEAVELVYLGVADTARGRGLGKALLRYGWLQASRTGARHMLLAVDEGNAPAIALYRAAGFRSQQRRVAWVRFLP